MRGRHTFLLSAAALLLAACHGPPIMARLTPRPVTARSGAPRAAPARVPPRQRADPLRAPFLAREGRPESVVTERMIDEIERAVLLRRKAREAAGDPCDQAIERARRLKYQPRVGQEERGSIAIPVQKLWKLLERELRK